MPTVANRDVGLRFLHALAIAAVVLGLSSLAPSAAAAEPLCFDFSRPVEAPLVPLPPTSSLEDLAASGSKRDGVVWGQVRGRVARPLARVMRLLQDYRRWRDERVDELVIDRRPADPHLARFRVQSTVRPFPFVTVEWVDEWVFSLLDGTPSAPRAVLVSHQKVEGTAHIDRHCGSLVLREVDGSTTEVLQYDEARITGRSAKDQVDGMSALLAFLRHAR
ncbi:MAG: hypothetical protein IT384_10090 [Deltaproteobacteria bacterium]|nr:hypothetical protein [Deltaproteobacteria bacterium]